MEIDFNQNWIDQNKELFLKVLEADFDPHLKRIDPNSLVFVNCKNDNDGNKILELNTLVLEYGGCSGVSHETPELRRLKLLKETSDLEASLIALL
jgi:hypothetical protein